MPKKSIENSFLLEELRTSEITNNYRRGKEFHLRVTWKKLMQ